MYVTDSLRIIGNLDVRYKDVISTPRVVDNRSPKEIVDSIKGKIRALGMKNV